MVSQWDHYGPYVHASLYIKNLTPKLNELGWAPNKLDTKVGLLLLRCLNDITTTQQLSGSACSWWHCYYHFLEPGEFFGYLGYPSWLPNLFRRLECPTLYCIHFLQPKMVPRVILTWQKQNLTSLKVLWKVTKYLSYNFLTFFVRTRIDQISVSFFRQKLTKFVKNQQISAKIDFFSFFILLRIHF